MNKKYPHDYTDDELVEYFLSDIKKHGIIKVSGNTYIINNREPCPEEGYNNVEGFTYGGLTILFYMSPSVISSRAINSLTHINILYYDKINKCWYNALLKHLQLENKLTE